MERKGLRDGAADDADFSALLRRARVRDPAALEALYARYRGHVIAAVRPHLPGLLRRKYDTMDFVQSVFAEVIRDLSRLEDRGEHAFMRLLAIKARNRVRLKLRRHLGPRGGRAEARLSTDADAGSSPDVVTALGSREEDEKLHRLLARLDATSREVVHLRSEGRSFPEIASVTGLSGADAARKRYTRALAEMRRLWDRAAD